MLIICKAKQMIHMKGHTLFSHKKKKKKKKIKELSVSIVTGT